MARRKRPKTSTYATTLIAAGVLFAGLYFAQDVLVPVVLSVLLTFLLAPIANRLERLGIGRIISVLVVVAIAFGMVAGLTWVVFRQIDSLADLLNTDDVHKRIERKVERLRTGGSFGDKFLAWGKEFEKVTSQKPATEPAGEGEANPTAPRRLAEEPGQVITEYSTKAAATTGPSPLGSTQANPVYTVPLEAPASPIDTVQSFLGIVGPPLGTTALVVVFVVFMLLEREQMRDRAIRLISGGRYTVTTTALNDAAKRISRYILAQTIVNGSYGLAIGLGLWVIGLTMGQGTSFPSVVLWGLLCAVLRFVPYVGPFVAGAFPLVLSLAVYDGFGVFFAVSGWIIFIELLSNNVMEPWLYGTSTGLSTIAILVAAVFWTSLWGTEGLLLSTPLTVCLVVMGKYVPQMKFLDVLLSDEPALAPSVSYYQRLLANNAHDAGKIAEGVAESAGADRVADSVFLPALRRSRRDRTAEQLSPEKEQLIFDATGRIAVRLYEPGVRSEPAARVLGCPAHHKSEELSLHLLSHLTAASGVNVDVVSSRSLPVDIENQIAQQKPAMVMIAVLPPGGLVQARYLCRRLRRKFPDLPILIGYWGRAKNFDNLLVKLRAAGASYVTTSLLQTRSQMLALLKLPAPPARAAAEGGTP